VNQEEMMVKKVFSQQGIETVLASNCSMFTPSYLVLVLPHHGWNWTGTGNGEENKMLLKLSNQTKVN